MRPLLAIFDAESLVCPSKFSHKFNLERFMRPACDRRAADPSCEDKAPSLSVTERNRWESTGARPLRERVSKASAGIRVIRAFNRLGHLLRGRGGGGGRLQQRAPVLPRDRSPRAGTAGAVCKARIVAMVSASAASCPDSEKRSAAEWKSLPSCVLVKVAAMVSAFKVAACDLQTACHSVGIAAEMEISSGAIKRM
jgi:hypothetical protein